MKTKLLTAFFLAALLTATGAWAGNTAAYIRGASQPWDESTNEAAMEAVFGPGGWDDLRMANGPGPFSAGYTFIFLEGGDNTALELADFLDDNRAAIEAYVAAGGNLLLNSAPNEGENIDFGFGGVRMIYSDGGFFPKSAGPGSSVSYAAKGGSPECQAVNVFPGHPVSEGPFLPAGTAYTGNGFCHGYVLGPANLVGIIFTTDPIPDEFTLAQMSFGSGCVLFGSMTTDNFHEPQPNAGNLRRNILGYTAAGSCAVKGVPALSIQGLLFIALLTLMLGVGVLYRRRRMVH